jgi:flagellar protein FliJ
MKGIDTLIKMHQRDLDGLRRRQVQLQDQREGLIQLATRLHEELMEERRLASENPATAAYMGDFEKKMKKRQIDIAKEVVQLDQQLAQLAAAIAESFGELKKYEITRDAEAERERARLDQQEQKALDEMGIQQFSRRNDSNK